MSPSNIFQLKLWTSQSMGHHPCSYFRRILCYWIIDCTN